MWIKFNRVLSEDGKYWIHPDFTQDDRTIEKYISPIDRSLFLANTTLTSVIGYEQFNVVEVLEADLSTEKRNFGVNTVISKWDFRQRMTDEEKVAISNYEITIDNQDPLTVSPAAKQYRKMLMKSIMDDYDVATMVTLTDPIMTKFATVIAGCEIISAQRIAEILQIV